MSSINHQQSNLLFIKKIKTLIRGRFFIKSCFIPFIPQDSVGLAFKCLARIINTNPSILLPSNMKMQMERSNHSHNFFFTFLPSIFFFFYYCGSIFHSSWDVYTMMQTRLMKMVVVVSEEGKVRHQQMAELTAWRKQHYKTRININDSRKLVYRVGIGFPWEYSRSPTR